MTIAADIRTMAIGRIAARTAAAIIAARVALRPKMVALRPKMKATRSCCQPS
jgi:hypothetical protein